MKNKKLFKQLEGLGRERLSSNFYMREFLHSEISQVENIPNIPHYPDIAIRNGKRLCEDILEPIQDSLGRISIRSGYRSPEINSIGTLNKNQYNCASNARNYSSHIWDYPDSQGFYGATACVVICAYVDYYNETRDWKTLAKRIQGAAPLVSSLTFHPKLCAVNISWHQQPKKTIRSYIRIKKQMEPN